MATRKSRRQRRRTGRRQRQQQRRMTMRGGRAAPANMNDGTADGETVQKITVIAYMTNNVKKIKVIDVTKDNNTANVMANCVGTEAEIAGLINGQAGQPNPLQSIKDELGGQDIVVDAITVVSSFAEFKDKYNVLEVFQNQQNQQNQPNTNITAFCLAGVIKNENGKRSIVQKDRTPLLNFYKAFNADRTAMFGWDNTNQGNEDWTIIQP